jgi:AcrR family transcriptional regulator
VPPTKPAPAKTRVRDGARTRRLILEAAFDEFTAKGLAGARMEAVAERAGVNVRAIYQHFDSKDGLYEAVFGDSFSGKHAGVIDALTSVIERPDGDRADAAFLVPRRRRRSRGSWSGTPSWPRPGLHPRARRADVRRDLYAGRSSARTAQRADGLWTSFDADLLLVALMGLAIYHTSRPPGGMIAGASSDSPEFRLRWNAFLERLGPLWPPGRPRPRSNACRRLLDEHRLVRVAAGLDVRVW